jgi:hypothetical protein
MTLKRGVWPLEYRQQTALTKVRGWSILSHPQTNVWSRRARKQPYTPFQQSFNRFEFVQALGRERRRVLEGRHLKSFATRASRSNWELPQARGRIYL